MITPVGAEQMLAVLLLFLCFLLVGYFERQDQELFERMAPFTEAMR